MHNNEKYESAKDAGKHDLANMVCAEIWDIWYGEHKGQMNPDNFSKMLQKIKLMIRQSQ